jgi:hypothetical protein
MLRDVGVIIEVVHSVPSVNCISTLCRTKMDWIIPPSLTFGATFTLDAGCSPPAFDSYVFNVIFGGLPVVFAVVGHYLTSVP